MFRESFHSIKSDKVCLHPKEEEGRRKKKKKRKKTEKKSEILLLKNDQKPLKTLNIGKACIQNRSAAEFRTDRTKRAAAKHKRNTMSAHTHTHKDAKTSRLSYKRHKRFLTDAPSLRLENNTVSRSERLRHVRVRNKQPNTIVRLNYVLHIERTFMLK